MGDDPFKCCLMDQQISDKNGNVWAITTGTICQLGMCCPCCADVKFEVLKNESPVALVTKPPLNFTECFCNTNRFLVEFQQITDPIEKRMIFAAAMLLDLEYFEQNKNNDG